MTNPTKQALSQRLRQRARNALGALGRLPRSAVFANAPLRAAFLLSLAIATLLPLYVYLNGPACRVGYCAMPA